MCDVHPGSEFRAGDAVEEFDLEAIECLDAIDRCRLGLGWLLVDQRDPLDLRGTFPRVGVNPQ